MHCAFVRVAGNTFCFGRLFGLFDLIKFQRAAHTMPTLDLPQERHTKSPHEQQIAVPFGISLVSASAEPTMAHYLPREIMVFFRPPPPLPYKAPVEVKKPPSGLSGVGQFVERFKEPAPPPVKNETPQEKRAKRKI